MRKKCGAADDRTKTRCCLSATAALSETLAARLPRSHGGCRNGREGRLQWLRHDGGEVREHAVAVRSSFGGGSRRLDGRPGARREEPCTECERGTEEADARSGFDSRIWTMEFG
ncbi:uncharacterized protein DS421_6g184150 [Arachis hypogaea]|nr:uncharacterized protein DS421_6g184150 [Arachis hypogaea]